MYATAPTTEIFVSRPLNAFHGFAPRTTPRKGTATPATLGSSSSDIDAWARHASAANGFGEAAIGLEPRSGTQDRHGS
jgi:hypothetical protein